MTDPTRWAKVEGRCPACGQQTLLLNPSTPYGTVGHPKALWCGNIDCPDPYSARKVLNLDHRHVLEVSDDGGWSIEHPVTCRLDHRRLLDCTVHRMVQQDLDGRERPSHPGRYWINPLPAGGFGTEKIES